MQRAGTFCITLTKPITAGATRILVEECRVRRDKRVEDPFGLAGC